MNEKYVNFNDKKIKKSDFYKKTPKKCLIWMILMLIKN